MAEGASIHKAGFVEGVEQLYATPVLETLLKDRTTGKNIIWADDEYESLGEGYQGSEEITLDKITGTYSGVIKPRVAKEREKQSQRTREHAEVFTPSWLCNQMNNYMDDDWFGREGVFSQDALRYTLYDGNPFDKEALAEVEEKNANPERSWIINEERIEFPDGKTWRDYVDLTKLEITCGEAPFVCSRYDTVSGDVIPVPKRIGFLDRKLRVVTENAKDYKEWYEWAKRALQSSYGYEYQGDNLIIARFNAIQTIDEHKLERWGERLSDEEAAQIADIVSWNFWQMDGLKGTVPSDKPIDQDELDRINGEDDGQMSMFDLFDMGNEPDEEEKAQFCMIYDWRENKAQEYVSLRSKGQ